MIRVFYYILIFAFTSNLWAGWLPSSDYMTGEGYSVDAIYFQPLEDHPDGGTNKIVFYSNSVSYTYNYTLKNGEMPQKAKAILGMLLSAKSTGAKVFVFVDQPNGSAEEFRLLIVGK